MSSKNTTQKYIPPWLRNRQTAAQVFNEAPAPAPVEQPKEKPYEEEFPALTSTTAPTMKVWGGGESFAKKAEEWSVYEKNKQLEEETKRKEQEMLNALTPRTLPKFRNVRRFVEEDSESEHDSENDDSKPEQKIDEDEQGWIEVKSRRRVKKAKTVEQLMNEEFAKPAEDDNGETVWNEETQPNETCWDDRY